MAFAEEKLTLKGKYARVWYIGLSVIILSQHVFFLMLFFSIYVCMILEVKYIYT